MEDKNGCIILGLDNLEARKVPARIAALKLACMQMCAAALLTPFMSVDVPQDVQLGERVVQWWQET